MDGPRDCCTEWSMSDREGEISYAAAAAKSLQSCPTLCDPIDGSPPGSPVPGILQARTLEWVTISFPNAWKWKVKVKLLSRVQPQRPYGLQPSRLLHPWDFPGKSTGVGCHLASLICGLYGCLYTLLHLKWIINKDLQYSTPNSAQCYVAAWIGAGFGGEWIHVYIYAESLCCSPKTITILLIGYSESCSAMSDSLRQSIQSMEFSRPEYWRGSLSFLQGIFPTQGSNPGLPHSRQILYPLSHKGSPLIGYTPVQNKTFF